MQWVRRLVKLSNLRRLPYRREPKVEIRPGDVITCPVGKKHWHGASPTTAMTHMAIQESLNGKNVEWLEKVTDEQYLSE
jgi:quercetin dioxygenase-like cupin family protein